ncbi:hypothetical protein K439DRAFT_979875 [Ramaria rubella]|nr:hypothetical protein K439DRAFT_979875 [Ramaria rubella]
MLLYLISRIISASGAFLYPTYASYKTLSRRPASEVDIERWLMYWSVLGTLLALEYVAEWLVSWLPFYHTLKTLFLLYLALPQTRGASYVYTVHLYPLLARHEPDIDAALVRYRERVLRWAQAQLRALWERVVAAGAPQAQQTHVPQDALASAAPPAPGSTSTSGSAPAQLVYGLWTAYGPALAALFQPKPIPTHMSTSPSPPPRSSPSPPPPPPQVTLPTAPITSISTSISVHNHDAILARRRALEAELAALPVPQHEPTIPVAASTYLPVNGDDRGRYDEIARDEVEEEDEQGVAYKETRAGGWFWGWGGGGAGGGAGYEHVKTD